LIKQFSLCTTWLAKNLILLSSHTLGMFDCASQSIKRKKKFFYASLNVFISSFNIYSNRRVLNDSILSILNCWSSKYLFYLLVMSGGRLEIYIIQYWRNHYTLKGNLSSSKAKTTIEDTYKVNLHKYLHNPQPLGFSFMTMMTIIIISFYDIFMRMYLLLD
jgi:hypothetical protein